MSELLTVKEAAELLRVNKYSIYRWIEAGSLPARRLGHGRTRAAIRIKQVDLENFGRRTGEGQE